MLYRNDPREITARFDSFCPETGKTIKKGEHAWYYPRERKAYHVDSKTAVDGRECMADAQWEMDCGCN